jgi:hypothetical protein
MSQIEDFTKTAMNDAALRADLSTLAGKSRAEIIGGVSAIAASHGFALSEVDIAAAMDRHVESARARDLNEAELDRVAAGSCDPKIYLESFF